MIDTAATILYNVSTCQGINGRFVCPEQPLFCNARIPWQGLGKLQDSGFLFGVDMTKEIPLTQGKVALVDDGDYEGLACYKWWAKNSGNTFYAGRYSDGNRNVMMHRVIMNAGPGDIIDHANGNGLDNRKCNLRLCTKSQNMSNRGKNPNNTSGYKGVGWYPNRSKWFAHIGVGNRHKTIGYYDTPEEAARAYDEAAKKYHGEFAGLNFPD